MATPARKSLPSRKVATRASVSKRSGVSSRTTVSRKTTSRIASTARNVRSGRGSSTTSTKQRVLTARSASITASRRKKPVATRTQNKRVQRTKKPTKQSGFFTKLQGLIVSFFVLLLFLFVGWYFILPSVLLHTSDSKNIVYVSNNIDSLSGKILFAHLDTNKAKNALYILDGREEVEVPNGYGNYAVGAVPSLLKMDQQSDGTILSIMSRIFRLPIDEVIMAEPLSNISNSESREQGSKLAGALQSIAFQSVSKDPQQAMTILRLSFLARKASQLEDVGSYKKTSDLVTTSALELSAEEKSCSVAVINTTGKSNLARETAQVLEQNGVYIIREDSTSQIEAITRLQVSTELKSECEVLFGKLVPFFPETSTRELQTAESKRYRADIVIFLGTDITTAAVAE